MALLIPGVSAPAHSQSRAVPRGGTQPVCHPWVTWKGDTLAKPGAGSRPRGHRSEHPVSLGSHNTDSSCNPMKRCSSDKPLIPWRSGAVPPPPGTQGMSNTPQNPAGAPQSKASSSTACSKCHMNTLREIPAPLPTPHLQISYSCSTHGSRNQLRSEQLQPGLCSPEGDAWDWEAAHLQSRACL